MKLLELMVHENVQWPAGALGAVQDFDKELKFYEVAEPPTRPEYSCSGEVWYLSGYQDFDKQYLAVRASDWDTKAVSKAEYDAATAAAMAAACQPTDALMRDWYAELAPIIAVAAEGKVVQYLAADGNWYTSQGAFMHPNKYRVKPEEPKTIKVNGFDVPEPMREAPAKAARYYVASTQSREWYLSRTWGGWELDLRCLRRGLVYATAEAAVAHAKAMLGIDPYATEGADDEHS